MAKKELRLSKRQAQIVYLLMQDYSSKEVASMLGLKTTHTSNYLDNARKKFGVKTTIGLIVKLKDLEIESLFDKDENN